jgi:phthiocerol/phenolphthiocerol synthesis type-I polyketide synthase E
LWMSWGVEPADMVGHSVGEFVAACLASVFSLEDALVLVATRGRLMQSHAGGGMLAVGLGGEQVAALLDGQDLSLAALNSPSHSTVSGNSKALEEFKLRLAERNVAYRALNTSGAFHSSVMDPIVDEFADAVRQVKRNVPRIPFMSNVSGTWIAAEQAISPEYWATHLRQTVQFSPAVRILLEDSNRAFLEVGPGNTLSTLVKQHLNGSKEQKAVFASLRHPQEHEADDAFILRALGSLWLAGVSVDWPGFYAQEKRRRVQLPTYPFERRRHWIDATEPPKGYFATRAALTGAHSAIPHEADAPVDDRSAVATSVLVDAKTQAPQDALERQLAGIFERLLGVHSIEPTSNFFDLGGTSLTAIRLFSEIKQLTGKNLPLATLIEAPTIEKLAAVLREDSPRWSSLVPIQTDGSHPPLFLIHGAEGNVLLYRQLAQHLGPRQPVYGFQSQGLNGTESFHTSIEQMAAHYIRQLPAVQPRGPYRLGGYCLGGMVALEMAQQLMASGEQVSLVALVETYNPNAAPSRKIPRVPGMYLAQDIWFHAANVFLAADKERWRFFREKCNVQAARAGVRVRALYHSMKSKHREGQGSEFPHLTAKKFNDRAAGQYVPKPYSGRVVLFRPKSHFLGHDQFDFGWREILGDGLEVRRLPMFPKGMLVEPFVQNLARELGACLSGA